MACEYIWNEYANGVHIDHPCQFPASTPSVMSQGRPYCLWHLSVVDKLNWSHDQKQLFDKCLRSHLATIGTETNADFRGVVFPEDISFDGMALDKADFRNATFIGKANFCKARFTSLTNFAAASFLKNARFDEASFLGVTYFDAAKFSGNLSCLKASFEQTVTFSKASIRGHAQFSETCFKSSATFENTNFQGLASFSRVTFDVAEFTGASIASNADFSRCKFEARAIFIDTVFGYGTEFDGATFEKDAHFQSGRSETERLPRTTWRDTRFMRDVSFNNRVFSTLSDFSQTLFEKAPTYHGCTFHEAMLFPLLASFRERAGKPASEAYRTLRLAMEKMSAHLEAGKFYALEQESRRNTPDEMRRHERLLSLLYSTLSDYGQNALRPLAIVLTLLLCLVPIYALSQSAPLALDASLDGRLLAKALNFSLQQVVSPFGLWRGQPPGSLLADSNMPTWVIWTATLQSLSSIVLVSLSLLAIRWRFKRE